MKTIVVILVNISLCLFTHGRAMARAPWVPQADMPRAVSLYPPRHDIKLGPEDRSRLHKALSFLGFGKYQNALPLLDLVLNAQPSCKDALRARTRTLLTMGYLKWKHEMVIQALSDAKLFLWLVPGDAGMKDLLALLEQLNRRMSRISKSRKIRASRKQQTGR